VKSKVAIRVSLALALLGVGWSAGRAQEMRRVPDFRVEITIPPGQTMVRCVSGCAVAIFPHVPPPPGSVAKLPVVPGADAAISATCDGVPGPTCTSILVDGWLIAK